MNAIIVAVGDELITGQTIDTNSAFLARQLAELGIETCGHRTVRDDRAAIAKAIRESAAGAGLVLITGGLGPTDDDLTRHGLADAMGAELVLDETCLEKIKEFFRVRGRTMIPANSIQAMIPAGAEPIANRLGTAPGIAAVVEGAKVFVMPGVPAEMKCMFAERIAPRLGRGAQAVVHRLVHAFGTGESDIGAKIADLMARGANPLIGTTVGAGMVTVRIAARGKGEADAQALAAETAAEIRRRLGRLVVGEDDATLGSAVGDLLRRRGQTLATAESCTGGLVGKLLTDPAGASDFYLGGLVAYANRVKQQALCVPAETLDAFGAVSEQAAAAMAVGCREALASDWAVSVTGIAGPRGGSQDKPVGLVYIGLADSGAHRTCRHVFPGTREIIRRRAAMAALNHLRLALLGDDGATGQ